jgi:hypothetical protein
MNILWPVISVYVLPIFLAYFFSGVYYIICDVSNPVDDRPKYLSNPAYINLVGVLWLNVLVRSTWKGGICKSAGISIDTCEMRLYQNWQYSLC